MRMLELLRRKNRTVLEMETGILFCGVVLQITGIFLAKDIWYYTKSLWFGILLAIAATRHMYHTLNRALDCDEKTAAKIIFGGYMIRYVILVAFLLVIVFTEVMQPLIVFIAYMSLKVTVYLQPTTHKLCNKIFRETDPVPQPLAEEKELPDPCEEGENEV